MNKRAVIAVTAALAVVGIGIYLFYPPLWLIDVGEYDTTTVSIYGENDTQLASVDVRIADNQDKRVIGLSRTDSLDNGSGMLFVHSQEDTHEYVMRDMAFSLDIIFIDSEGSITRIHHAPQNSDEKFRGKGQYILEVPRGWSNATGVSVGDTVEIPDDID